MPLKYNFVDKISLFVPEQVYSLDVKWLIRLYVVALTSQ